MFHNAVGIHATSQCERVRATCAVSVLLLHIRRYKYREAVWMPTMAGMTESLGKDTLTSACT